MSRLVADPPGSAAADPTRPFAGDPPERRQRRPRGRARRLPPRLGTSALAVLTAWWALLSWSALMSNSVGFLRPAFVCGVVIVLVGGAARMARLPWWVTTPLQSLACLVVVTRIETPAHSWHGWVPTPAALSSLAHTVQAGSQAMNRYYSPLPSSQTAGYATLLVEATIVLLLIDLVAVGWRRIPLAGLVILAVFAIPISVGGHAISWLVFVPTALLFLMLLATDESRLVTSWNRGTPSLATHDSSESDLDGSSVRAVAIRVGLLATVAALVIPWFVPVLGRPLSLHSGPGHGGGPGATVMVNPLLDLRHNLVQANPQTMLTVHTDNPDPRYVQLTVLDMFTGRTWEPSPRVLPAANRLPSRRLGPMPPPIGLSSGVPTSSFDWRLHLADNYATAWLPVPASVSALKVPGDWRFDSRTEDVVDFSPGINSAGLGYAARQAVPQFDSTELDNAVGPPGSIQGPMTVLPRDVPKVIIQTAYRVTRGAHSNLQLAQDLQRWFRSTGGFVYSTKNAAGAGMGELARFITTHKVGYCEQFASAMAVMARTVGIPSRVVVGFLSGHRSRPDTWTFGTHDLHAWPQLYFSGYGWVTFDPTPGTRTGTPPAYTTQRANPHSATKPTPTHKAVTPGTLPPASKPGTHGHHGSQTVSVPVWAWPAGIGVLVVLLLALTPRLFRDASRRRRLDVGQPPTRLAEGVWMELRATVLDVGLPWPEGRTPRQTAHRLEHGLRLNDEERESLGDIVGVLELARYAPALELDAAGRGRLLEQEAVVRAAVRRTTSPTRRRWSAVLPASTFDVLSRRRPLGQRATGVAETSVGERV